MQVAPTVNAVKAINVGTKEVIACKICKQRDSPGNSFSKNGCFEAKQLRLNRAELDSNDLNPFNGKTSEMMCWGPP